MFKRPLFEKEFNTTSLATALDSILPALGISVVVADEEIEVGSELYHAFEFCTFCPSISNVIGFLQTKTILNFERIIDNQEGNAHNYLFLLEDCEDNVFALNFTVGGGNSVVLCAYYVSLVQLQNYKKIYSVGKFKVMNKWSELEQNQSEMNYLLPFVNSLDLENKYAFVDDPNELLSIYRSAFIQSEGLSESSSEVYNHLNSQYFDYREEGIEDEEDDEEPTPIVLKNIDQLLQFSCNGEHDDITVSVFESFEGFTLEYGAMCLIFEKLATEFKEDPRPKKRHSKMFNKLKKIAQKAGDKDRAAPITLENVEKLIKKMK